MSSDQTSDINSPNANNLVVPLSSSAFIQTIIVLIIIIAIIHIFLKHVL